MGRWSRDPRDKIAVGRGVLRKLLPSRVWHFHHKDAAGKWTSRSTSHRDKDGAIEWANGHSLQLTREEHGLGEPARKVSNDRIADAIADWLAYQKTQNKPTTYRTYTSVMNNLKEFLETRPNCKRLGEMDRDTMLAFRQWHLDRKNARSAADNNLVAIRSFFNWCIALGKVRANPVRQEPHGVRLFFDDPLPRIETYTEAEYASIVECASEDLGRVCVILANSGLRISELAVLEWSDVDLVHKWLHVRVKTTHDGFEYRPKDDTDRKIPINAALEAALSELATVAGRAGYVLPLPRVKSRIDYGERTLLGELKEVAPATGIKAAKLTLHNFRRYFVSQCADSGIDMPCVMNWVGHDGMQMVMHYYRLRDKSSQTAMQRFSDGARPPAASGVANAAPRKGGHQDRTGNDGKHLEHLGSGDKKLRF